MWLFEESPAYLINWYYPLVSVLITGGKLKRKKSLFYLETSSIMATEKKNKEKKSEYWTKCLSSSKCFQLHDNTSEAAAACLSAETHPWCCPRCPIICWRAAESHCRKCLMALLTAGSIVQENWSIMLVLRDTFSLWKINRAILGLKKRGGGASHKRPKNAVRGLS